MTEAHDLKRARAALNPTPWSAEQHRRVRGRLDDALSKPPRAFWASPAFAVALAVLFVVGAGGLWRAARPSPNPSSKVMPVMALAQPGTPVDGAAGPRQARFVDGSTVEVAHGGTLEVLTDGAETRLEVTAGRAVFEVQGRKGRPFVVAAQGVEVSVVGTRFAVELDASRSPTTVRVAVMHGVVEVRKPGNSAPSRVSGGQSLEISQQAEVVAPQAAATSEDSAPAARPRALEAAQLFEEASAARKSGDVAAAIRAYRTLLKQYPSDQRAGVVALELGRLNMDVQHDYAAAVTAFRRALAVAPNNGIREDAQARLVGALDAMHSFDTCVTERKRYLAAFPRGVHALSVQGRCSGH